MLMSTDTIFILKPLNILILENADQQLMPELVTIGSHSFMTITVTEENLAPSIRNVLLYQQEQLSGKIYKNDGMVEMRVNISDANIDDTHIIDFTSETISIDEQEGKYTFDPMPLDEGNHTIQFTVEDSGIPALSNNLNFNFMVAAGSNTLCKDFSYLSFQTFDARTSRISSSVISFPRYSIRLA